MLHNHRPFNEFKKIRVSKSASSDLQNSSSPEALNIKSRRHGFTIRRHIWEFLTEQARKAVKTGKRFMWRVTYKSRRRMRRARHALAERRRNHQQRRRKSRPLANPSSMLALEPRIVFDAAAAATVDQTADQVAEQQADDAADNRASDSPSNDNQASSDDFASVAVTENDGREIAFVDGSLEDIDQLLSEIDPSVEIIMLDVNQDGVEQIAAALQGRDNINAIHILSHGSPGQLSLGTGTLTSETIRGEYADELAIVREALADNGDILIYGCDFTAGTLGQEAAQLLSDVTGADIAASDDDTGHDSLGGDWDLETQIGVINVESIQAVNWEQLMAPLVVTQVDGTTTTATTLANNIAGSGVTVTGVTFAGANNQAGTFTGATGFANEWLGFDSGVVLSTGDVNNTGSAPAVLSSTPIGSAGDADLEAIANATSFDASVLEIDFIPTASVVALQFTFGSEEYNEYVYSNFNDAVGVWVNGVHTSLTPTGNPNALDEINQAATFIPALGVEANDPNPGNGVFDSSNPSLYIDNSTGNFNVVMDGFTVTLTFTANVDVGVTNTIKIGITDIGNDLFDSWIFISENSLQTNTLAHNDFTTTNINTAVAIDALANDTDAEGDPLSITHITDKPITAGGAAVTLASGATVQLTLAGQLVYTPATGQTGIENFTYSIADGTGSTAAGYVSVNIGANTAPVVDLDDDGTSASRNFTTAFTEGGAAVAISANNAGIVDPNDTSFPQLDVTLGGFLSAGNEILSIGGTTFTFGTAQTSIVHLAGLSANVAYDGANDFTITSAALGIEMSESALEDLIQSITYDHAGDSVSSGARTLSFQVSDGGVLSNIAVSTINVTGIFDTDQDGVNDADDLDDDNDGILDAVEGNFYDLTQASLDGSLWVTAQDTVPTGIAFSNDGLTLLITGNTGDTVEQYSLTTAFDVTSGVTLVTSFSVGAQETQPNSLRFSGDGLKMFILGNTGNDITQYSLTSPFDLTVGVSVDGTFSVGAQESAPLGMAFNNNGTKMYIVGQDADTVFEYVLSIPYDVLSGVTLNASLSVGAQETDPRGVVFNAAGTQMFVIGYAGDAIDIYDLATAYDVTTAVYSGDFSIASEDGSPQDLTFNADGSKLFIVGSGGDRIYQYTFETDSDGDGILDQFDLDSDNDGITDNVEAQTTAGYIAPSGTGAAITDADGDGLDDNYDANTTDTTSAASVGLTPVDTDSDSTVDMLDTDSDNDGITDTDEAGHGITQATIDASADTDGDGLKDVVEGANASDDFDVNDENLDATDTNFLLAAEVGLATDGSNAVPLSIDLSFRDNTTDTDQDGVNDTDDLDDDNDGILDAVEGVVEITDWWTTDGDVTASGNTVVYDGSPSGTWGLSGIRSNYLSSYGASDNYTVSWTVSNTTNLAMSGLGIVESNGSFTDIDYAIFTRDNSKLDIYENGALKGTFGTYAADDQLSVTASGGTITYQLNGTTFYTSLTAYTPGSTDFYVDTAFYSGAVSYENYTIGTEVDSDGDGIFDQFDLDSDNDGITDNVEAQTTAGYIAPSGTGLGITDVDHDGIDDAYDDANAELILNGEFSGNIGAWVTTGQVEASSSRINFNTNNSTNYGDARQTVDTVSGQSYTLTFEVGRSGTGSGTVGLDVQALDGATVLANEVVTKTNANSWTSHSITFVATSDQTTILLDDVSTATVAIDVRADNISLMADGFTAGTTISPVDTDSDGTVDRLDTQMVMALKMSLKAQMRAMTSMSMMKTSMPPDTNFLLARQRQ